MKTVTLARALQIKKRLAEDISRVSTDIQLENRIATDNERNVDIRQYLAKRKELVTKLTNLKLKIFEAANPIRQSILDLAELKSESSFLQSISTDSGKQHRRGILGESDVEYTVVITKNEVNTEIKRIEAEIDRIQYDIIDKHNAVTFVEIED